MCGAATYTVKGDKVTVYFPNLYAKIPVLLKDGSKSLSVRSYFSALFV
jgi:hypothetical protein